MVTIHNNYTRSLISPIIMALTSYVSSIHIPALPSTSVISNTVVFRSLHNCHDIIIPVLVIIIIIIEGTPLAIFKDQTRNQVYLSIKRRVESGGGEPTPYSVFKETFQAPFQTGKIVLCLQSSDC